MNYYYCSKCNKLTQRDSDKKKIKSTCDESGESVFIVKVKDADTHAIKLRRQFLKNLFALETFTKKERMFLEMAFEQGAKVVFNSLTNK